ncbi:ParA family protein [Paraburkholderia bannensis]|uniref:ParA family protein n=1 Tax=Paraburkholderia bannensis TaxID=765414 RepID=UPI000486BB6B|nr:ParA family protein [Paraburkholderia bannensis]
MKTIIVASQKGGSSKTTIVECLAVEAERAGDGPVWVIDTDQQGTLSEWHDRRAVEAPQRADVALSRVGDGLAALAARGASWCFVDTAPASSKQNAALLTLADLVLIPVRPSPADLWAVAETVEAVKEAGKPFLFVVSQAKQKAGITAQAVAALSQHGPVAEAFMADRVAYAVAMTSGQTAPELAAKGPAAAEVAHLWECVKSCFHEKKQPQRVRKARG